MQILNRAFFDRPVERVAEDLLGKLLARRNRDGLTSGIIVEVEAYLAEGDSACHAARGPTPGNRAMFGGPGRSYVYPIHARYCFVSFLPETRMSVNHEADRLRRAEADETDDDRMDTDTKLRPTVGPLDN